MQLQPGTRIREYEITGLIGEGGMGEVYLAVDPFLNRKVAIKILHTKLTRDPKFAQRFRNEAKIQAQLNHPNIVLLLTSFEEGGVYYIVMEYAAGSTLEEILKASGAVGEARANKIMAQVADALAYAHDKGIIHRDIKPSNIMVDIEHADNVKVMDFGIARMVNSDHLTLTGTQPGTIHYMSPEQVLALPDIDRRSDVYSAGIVYYEMLTGKLPYDVDTGSPYKIQDQIMRVAIPDPRSIVKDISPRTVALLEAITEKDRDNRPERIFLHDAEDVSAGQFGPVTHTPGPDKPKKERSSGRLKYVFVGVAIVVLVLALLLIAVPDRKPGEPSRVADPDSLKVNPKAAITTLDMSADSLRLVMGGTIATKTGTATISPFYIGTHEVTQNNFNAMMRVPASGEDAIPATNVTWMEAIEYCNRLSKIQGLELCYEYSGYGRDPDSWPQDRNSSGKHTYVTCNWEANGYRLPTEAEWLYAANEGAGTLIYNFSGNDRLSDVGWYQNNATSLRPIGLKTPNRLGLYDMSGNACEYVWDRFNGSLVWNSVSDPRGPSYGTMRVVKGGSWKDNSDWCTITKRGSLVPHQKSPVLGFRIARSI